MRCHKCGQFSDWIGQESEWTRVGDAGSAHALYQCEACGNQQRARG